MAAAAMPGQVAPDTRTLPSHERFGTLVAPLNSALVPNSSRTPSFVARLAKEAVLR